MTRTTRIKMTRRPLRHITEKTTRATTNTAPRLATANLSTRINTIPKLIFLITFLRLRHLQMLSKSADSMMARMVSPMSQTKPCSLRLRNIFKINSRNKSDENIAKNSSAGKRSENATLESLRSLRNRFVVDTSYSHRNISRRGFRLAKSPFRRMD